MKNIQKKQEMRKGVPSPAEGRVREGWSRAMRLSPVLAISLMMSVALLDVVMLTIVNRPRPVAPIISKRLHPEPVTNHSSPVTAERKRLDDLYGSNPRAAESKFTNFVIAHKSDKDAKVQDEVGTARIRLAYLAANRKDYSTARARLVEAVQDYHGTGKMSGDYGGVKDQAAYQAAVSYVAEGKTEEARVAFVKFIKDYKTSPLAVLAYRRLVRLNGGTPKPEYEELVQSAESAREQEIKKEIVSCGPKAVAYLLKLLSPRASEGQESAARSAVDASPVGRPSGGEGAGGEGHPTQADLAKLLCTGDRGTTLDAIKKYLAKKGIHSYAVFVNARDFRHMPTPALLLDRDHYTVLRAIHGETMDLYDPFPDAERNGVALPSETDALFSINMLVFKMPEIGRSR